jgi:hypothetical protein
MFVMPHFRFCTNTIKTGFTFLTYDAIGLGQGGMMRAKSILLLQVQNLAAHGMVGLFVK